MLKVLVLGGGTAGTIVANRLRARFSRSELQICVVDRDDVHVYQPGLLFLPFTRQDGSSLRRPRRAQFRTGIDVVLGEVEAVISDQRCVLLQGGQRLTYDRLIIASGVSPRPEMTPGLLGAQWGRSVHEFYTLPGALALQAALRSFNGGRLVAQVIETPIKCPVAPLEFAFLADDWLDRHALRRKTELTFVTPLDGAFTRPVASRHLGGSLQQRKIALVTDFMVEEVDQPSHTIRSYDGREVGYDLLVSVPVNVGADYVAHSGLGNELNLVANDQYTMVAAGHPEIMVLGDAGTLPTSKAGSVAHFSIDSFMANADAWLHDRPLRARFDGHANCFVETGRGQAMLLDFNYDTEPLTGQFPIPKIGPMTLLKNSPINHVGKLAFEQLYWKMLLPGRRLPIPSKMSMAGKHRESMIAANSASTPHF